MERDLSGSERPLNLISVSLQKKKTKKSSPVIDTLLDTNVVFITHLFFLGFILFLTYCVNMHVGY